VCVCVLACASASARASVLVLHKPFFFRIESIVMSLRVSLKRSDVDDADQVT
jgi:hypothetical protein